MNQIDLPLRRVPKGARKMPSEPILRSASIERVGDAVLRWSMTRGWSTGPTIIWTLLNPSMADGKRDDPTTLRMMGFSYRWGFGSMVVTNVYPLVSSTTDRLRAWRKTFDHETFEALGMPAWERYLDQGSWAAFHHNQRLISKLLEPETVCVAAWGAGVPEADLDHFLHGVRLEEDNDEFGMRGFEIDWHCLGKTADGSPIHPLARGRHRVPDDAKLRVWKRARDTREERYG